MMRYSPLIILLREVSL